MKHIVLGLVAWTLLLGGAAGSRADPIVYTNFGTGDSYQTNASFAENGPSAISPNPSNVRQASQFTVGLLTDFIFTSARLALSQGPFAPGTNQIPDFQLYSDASGLPGTLLETIHESGTLGPSFTIRLTGSVFWCGLPASS